MGPHTVYRSRRMAARQSTPGTEWPATAADLVARQVELAAARPPRWRPPPAYAVGGCFVCFPRGASGRGARGDRGWAAEACGSVAVVDGHAEAPYVPGLLALREGPLLAAAVRALPAPPEVLLVDATGRDHPRRAGLATLLGALLDLPTVGVTHRPLVAAGAWPPSRRGAAAALTIGGKTVGCWLRVRDGVRPLAVHPAWRTELADAITVVLASTGRARTPEPVRAARTAARRARARR